MEQVPLSLPASILPSVNGVLGNCTSQFVRIQPNNQSTIVSAESGALSANLTVPTVVPFPSVPLEFTIPSGSSKNVFIDVSKSTLQFRVKYEVSTASTANYSIAGALQGSAYSWFERITEKVNGMVIDDQTGWDVACNSDLNWAYNVAERDANVLSLGLRGEPTSVDSGNFTQGHIIPAFTATAASLPLGSNNFSYSLPLKSSFLGIDCKSMVPVGRCGKIDMTLYTPNTAPVTIISTAAGGTGAKVKITMDQIFIELFYLTLDEVSASLLPGPERPWSIAGVTHRVGGGVIPAASQGAVSVQVPVRVKSARSISTRFVDSTQDTTGSVNGKYDSKCPLVSSMSYYLAGQKRVPNVPHSTQYSIANVFNHTMQAYYDGGMDRLKSKCGMSQDGFACYIKTATAPTAANGFDQASIIATSTTTVASLAGFEFAEDLRLASTSFLNGTDLTSSNSYLELNQTASYATNQQNLTFIVKADIIYVIMPNGNIEVRV